VSVSTFIAGQLRRPSGVFGRHVVSRILNRGNAAMNEHTLRLLELASDDRVLEVGFGGGDLIARMASVVTHGHIAGVDFSSDMTAFCTRRFRGLVQAGRLALHTADVGTLPHAAETFTKACTVNTIYFWPDPVAALASIRRVLREGGRLVVTFNPPATAGKLPYTKHGFVLYEPDQVRGLLQDAGFRDVEIVAGSSGLGDFFCAAGAASRT
jgi:ubiquinone/menaquinone biosynthesis C-methylase UbiE